MTRRTTRTRPRAIPRTPLRATLERPSVALAPREAGLHLWPHDSIGGVNERYCAPPGWSRRLDARGCDGHAPAGRRAARAARRARMAGHPARHDPGPAGPAGHRPSDRRLHRVRPVGRLAPRRPPRADLRAPAAAALRRAARSPLVGGGTGMIGDPSGRSTERNLLDRETLEANVAAIRGQLERFLDFTPGSRARADGQQPRLARRAVADRLPARHRQALHDPVHAGQGLRAGPARARTVVHRVQLHAPAGLRLRPPVPDDGRRAADGRRRPVGQHHRRPRAHPADQRGSADEGRAGARPRLQAAAVAVGREVRQERGRGLGLARPGAGRRRTRSTSTG